MLLCRLLVEVAADEGRPVVARFSDGTWQQLLHRLDFGHALVALARACAPQPADACNGNAGSEGDAGAHVCACMI